MSDSMERPLSRRSFIAATALSGAVIAAPRMVQGGEVVAGEAPGGRRRVLRVAHMTDTHIQPELGAPEGVSAALAHLHALDDKPGLILTGGDAIMDSFATDDVRADVQWDLWHRAWKENNDIPVKSCIGNHDIWGWNKRSSQTNGEEPGWGKQRAIDEFKMSGRYFCFDSEGWHFVVLDSVQHDPANANGYLAYLDNEQYEWLVADLAKTPDETPVLVLSHIPILSITTLAQGAVRGNHHVLPGGVLHIDAAKLRMLFKKHSNVRLCVSGHIHLVDQVAYDGVTYCCNGAVCGGWWKGDYKECDEGYALIDLYDDGSFQNQYVAYDWKPQG